MKLGVLAFQGDVPEHRAAVARAAPDATVIGVRDREDLAAIEALFLPGGESTTIARLLTEAGLWGATAERIRGGLPVLATCAGLILLARTLAPGPTGVDPPTLGVLDVTVRRNDYGAQRESFEAPIRVEGIGPTPFPGVFIRSPRILAVGRGVRPVAWRADEVVGVRTGTVWGLAFHPELSSDPRVHRAFLKSLRRRG